MNGARSRSLLILTILILIMASAPAWSDETAESTTAEPDAVSAPATAGPPAPPAGIAGLIVVVDPETGELRSPTADERARLSRSKSAAALTSRSTDGLRAERSPDGMLTLNLRGRFLKAADGQVDADGRLDLRHDAVVPVTPVAEDETDEAAAEPGREE